MTESPAALALARIVEALSDLSPVPAGGSAAVAAIAMGVALGVKVARISRAPDGLTEQLLSLSASLRPEFDADCDVFRDVLQTRREGGSPEAVAAAWRRAAALPRALAQRSDDARALLAAIRPHARPAVLGDLDAADALCEVGARIARANAQLNDPPGE